MKRCPICHQEYGDEVSICPRDGQSLPMASDPIDPMLGQVLDNKYRLEKCIGLGGMATVYLATRLQIGDEVAVKVLNPDSLKNPLAVARFRREAQAAARIRHNAVVTIHDMGTLPEGNTFLVMEYIKGHKKEALKLIKSPFICFILLFIGMFLVYLALCCCAYLFHKIALIFSKGNPCAALFPLSVLGNLYNAIYSLFAVCIVCLFVLFILFVCCIYQ